MNDIVFITYSDPRRVLQLLALNGINIDSVNFNYVDNIYRFVVPVNTGTQVGRILNDAHIAYDIHLVTLKPFKPIPGQFLSVTSANQGYRYVYIAENNRLVFEQ